MMKKVGMLSLLLFTSTGTLAADIPHIEGKWLSSGKILMEKNLDASGDLAKSLPSLEPYPIYITQEDMFFTMKQGTLNFENPKTTIDANVEIWYCVFKHDNKHFVCTDADEPAVIQGEVKGKQIFFTYVESGVKTKYHQNPFSVEYGIMNRDD